MSEDEVKQFESEKELSPSVLDNEQYRQRKASVEKQHPEFSSAIPAYSQPTGSQNLVGMPSEKIIGKEAKSADNKDLGEVKSVAASLLLLERELSRSICIKFQNHTSITTMAVLYVNAPSGLVSAKFERERD